MSDPYSSELEKTNLEIHVDMSRQRYAILSEKVETLDERMDAVIIELSEFRKEHAQTIKALRDEIAEHTQGTNKLFVGATAAVIGGLLNTAVVLLVALL